MSKLTGQEIIEKAKELYKEDISDFAYGPVDSLAGPVKQVFSSGGEDRGSDWRRVFHFIDHDIYLQVQGYYQSHHGTDFDDGWGCVTEVAPKEKTITVYE